MQKVNDDACVEKIHLFFYVIMIMTVNQSLLQMMVLVCV